MRFLNPTNDYAFKRIFGNEKHPNVLINFLNAVLDFPGDQQIVEVEILNPNQAPKIEALKETVLDVRAKDKKGQSFIVEMQVEPQQAFGKRALYYTSNAYTRQLKKGEIYSRLEKVYFIGILNFIAMESDGFISNHLILNKKTGENYLKDFEFCFIELPKFKKTENELEDIIDKWTYFVKYLGLKDYEVDYQNLFKGENAILEALKIAEYHNLNEKELEIYEYREKKQRDEYEVIRTATNKGLAEGLAEGLVEGEKKGIEKGLAEGKKEIAKNLKNKGMSFQEISDITNLALDEIEGL